MKKMKKHGDCSANEMKTAYIKVNPASSALQLKTAFFEPTEQNATKSSLLETGADFVCPLIASFSMADGDGSGDMDEKDDKWIHEWTALFHRIDTGGDTSVSQPELQTYMNKPSKDVEPECMPADTDLLLAALDKDGDKSLSLKEWKAVFTGCDGNKDGDCSVGEFVQMISP
eukprot:gnl/MRDRNA2_/MRDRNA2_43378_c0_seq2.p1 gnl/MRDRNA2_/MRDRNA2_43378_c0~~gnl/MRDRNA2_/MRDRNA2_43378_c0_seq2.p1  ORF type:complete len:172 (+),score=40.90 gnl/MRDRNA2_/MRDRNA2_43378_c0_seq2:84-599(+)